MSFLCWFQVCRVGIIVCQIFRLFSLIFGWFFSQSGRWEVIFIDLCVVLINLGYSFAQIWLSVGLVVRQGVPVIAFTVKVFVYCFTLFSSPNFFLTEYEECIAFSIGWVVLVDFLDFAVSLCEVEIA